MDISCSICGNPIEQDYIDANLIRNRRKPTMCKIHARHMDHGTGNVVACEDPECPLCGKSERGVVLGHKDEIAKSLIAQKKAHGAAVSKKK